MNKNNEIRQQNKLPGLNVDEPHGAEEIARQKKRAERFGKPTPIQKQHLARSSTYKKEGSNNKRKAQKTSIYRIQYNGGFEYKESEPVQKKRRVAHFSTGAGASCTPVEPCRNYRRGCCKRGDKCAHLHEYEYNPACQVPESNNIVWTPGSSSRFPATTKCVTCNFGKASPNCSANGGAQCKHCCSGCIVHDGKGNKIIWKNRSTNNNEKRRGGKGMVGGGKYTPSSEQNTSSNKKSSSGFICVKCEQIPAPSDCTAVNGRQCGLCCDGCARHPHKNEEIEVVQKRMHNKKGGERTKNESVNKSTAPVSSVQKGFQNVSELPYLAKRIQMFNQKDTLKIQVDYYDIKTSSWDIAGLQDDFEVLEQANKLSAEDAAASKSMASKSDIQAILDSAMKVAQKNGSLEAQNGTLEEKNSILKDMNTALREEMNTMKKNNAISKNQQVQQIQQIQNQYETLQTQNQKLKQLAGKGKEVFNLETNKTEILHISKSNKTSDGAKSIESVLLAEQGKTKIKMEEVNDELEYQQDLNQDLTLHTDRKMSEIDTLKAQIKSMQRVIDGAMNIDGQPMSEDDMN